MAVVPGGKIRVIWNYITVIKDVTVRVGVGPAIIGSSILWIAILAQVGFSTDIHWIMLAALSFDHARCIWEFGATGTVDHALGNSGIEDRVSDWIRDLSRDNGVDVTCIVYFKPLPQTVDPVPMITIARTVPWCRCGHWLVLSNATVYCPQILTMA